MSPISQKKNRIDQNAADQKLADGLTKHAAAIASLVVGGVTVSNKDIVTTLQARITARENAANTRATWRAAVQGDKSQSSTSRALVSGVKQALQVMFAGQIEILGDFGLTARKPRTPLTPEQKVAAVKKAEATRAARHTMGPKKKATITWDNPTGTAPAAMPSVSAPSATPAPAPAPSPAPVAVSPAPAAATTAQGPAPTPSKQ
jgi:hypothetical protein